MKLSKWGVTATIAVLSLSACGKQEREIDSSDLEKFSEELTNHLKIENNPDVLEDIFNGQGTLYDYGVVSILVDDKEELKEVLTAKF